MIRTSIASPQDKIELPFAQLREASRVVLESEGVKEAKISLAFVDNQTIHGINKRFLEHDEPTDVITFPMSVFGANKLEGELVIGVEIALEQSQQRGHALAAELCLYVIHGLLHLCGYDDLKPDDAAEMRTKERQYLQALGLPDITSPE
jgi:probable rRNA maturation factor